MKSDLQSMTGFGRGAALGAYYRCTVELRSVNGRYLELRPKLPRALLPLEGMLREKLQKQLRRGVVDLTVTLQPLRGGGLAVDTALASTYAQQAEALAARLGLSNGLNALELLRLPGVVGEGEIASEAASQELPDLLSRSLDEALQGLLEMRRAEGKKLALVLERELAEVEEHRAWIAKEKEALNEHSFRKLRARIEEWLGKSKSALDETRLYQEAAYYLDRNDITEELDRLSSHLRQCDDALAGKGKSAGKRLEFLAQELGREVNTIGAKSDQLAVTSRVLDMKLTLEKVREQLQNLE